MLLLDGAGNELEARGIFLGRTTNNIAEYMGVVKALEAAKRIGARRVKLFSDSELLVRQINGQYKVKSDNLKGLYSQAMELLFSFEGWEVVHTLRAGNEEADALVNMALDRKRDVERTPEKKAAERPSKPIRLGVLISGGGTTLLNILEHIRKGQLNAEVGVVVSSLSNVAGVERARAKGCEVKIIRRKDFADVDEFSAKLEEELTAAKVELVIQAGWLCLWKIPPAYKQRVMNIHPALLPSFGGKGMWGHRVHEAVLESGCKVSGCTVHFCTDEYDAGPIIVQRCCEVKEDDTADTLAARVFEQECIAYPEAIRLFQEGRLSVEGRRVKVAGRS